MSIAIIVPLVILLFLIIFILLRTLTFPRRIEIIEPVEGAPVDSDRAAKHLASAIRCQTISPEPGVVSREALFELHRLLEESYPRLQAALKRETINEYSLLYTWEGKQPNLPPVLLAAHQDVVPVEPSNLTQWTHPPFEGQIAGGYVWGRGALDNKHQLITILETVEALLATGYQPARTIYLAFGHDEEIGGSQGAACIVEHLKQQGVRLAAALDEGGCLVENLMAGVTQPIALVGTVEKGYLTLELTASGDSGHSSTPPKQTAIGTLARALSRLEKRPLPTRMDFASMMFQGIGPVIPFRLRAIFANQWLFGPLLRRILATKPQTNATLRTTTAITMISGGVKENILPNQAKAIVNFRLLPGDSSQAVQKAVQKIIGDASVQIQPRPGGAWEASPLSPTHCPAYRNLERTICQFFGMVPVAPYLVTGATDARYYTALCENVYRFTPTLLSNEDLARIHGTNERISVKALAGMIHFYIQLLRSWGENGL